MKSVALFVALSILALTGCKKTPPPQVGAPTPPQPVVTTTYPNLLVQADQLEAALANKDYAKFIDLTYPKVIEIGGGREKLLAAMTKEMSSPDWEGVAVLSSKTSAPTQYITDANGIYAVVPVSTKIKAKDGVFQLESSLIGVSTDGGQNWTFVDATGKDQIELKKILPNLGQLNIPPEKQPVKLATN